MAHYEEVRALSVRPTRVVFARVGWMTYYAGPQEGDKRPTGGGRYNKKNVGHELFNFAEFGGHLYGHAATSINLKRIDPTAGAVGKLDDVLVIFVARQHIIGWYRNATVYASTRPKFPASVTKEMLRRLKQSGMRGFRLIGYRFEAAVESATLLPTYERRKQKIPGNVKGGFGRSNIRYLFPTGGKTQISTWMEDAIQYVLTYDRANLLDDPSSEINLEEEASLAAERAAGFQSDPKVRKTIEQHAMKKAQKALEERGFSKFENTSATKPYDFTCWREEKPFFVEVKGTQTPGKTVILTKNEVEHVKSNPDNCVLVVVYSVKLTGKKTATAGMTDVTEKWDLTDGELTATQYLWRR
jgi:hypothetical protein